MKRNTEKTIRDGAVVAIMLAVIAVVDSFIGFDTKQLTALNGLASVAGLVGYRFIRDATQGTPS